MNAAKPTPRRLAALAVALLAFPALANEVLVQATATRVDPTPLSGRRSAELQNLGPDPIFCQLRSSSGLAVGKGRRLDANGGTWSVQARSGTSIWCVAQGAAQVTTAATIFTEEGN